MNNGRPSYSTSIGRWAGVGPYYAMFPIDFAFEIVKEYSRTGDSVLDPFAGRASSIYAAATLDRFGLGIEINPVGWLYGHVKLAPSQKTRTLSRLAEIGKEAQSTYRNQINTMPEFYHYCFSKEVLSFLLASRDLLKWKTRKVDSTIMALILVFLHGKKGQALSNQMRQSKAMSPEYSINWWTKRKLEPPEIDPVEFITKKIEWRYAKGTHKFSRSKVVLNDSLNYLRKISLWGHERFNLLLTSPPYFNVTNYHYDQWLRLWMLGGPELPISYEDQSKGKFSSKEKYFYLLHDVFSSSSRLMNRNSVIYVRSDARPFAFQTTLDVLTMVFPNKSIEVIDRPVKNKTQTALFGDKSKKPGEIDIILH